MHVGVLTVDLHLGEAQSLKDRRRILKSLVTRLRQRYNVSTAEIGEAGLWQRAEIGVAVISNSHAHAEEMLFKVIRFIEAQSMLTIVDHYLECR